MDMIIEDTPLQDQVMNQYIMGENENVAKSPRSDFVMGPSIKQTHNSIKAPIMG